MSNTHWLTRVPLLYPLLAFLLGKRTRIVGLSMAPALLPDEFVLFDRLAYRFDEPQWGDIVLAKDPRDGLLIVKRIAAVADDHVVVGARGCSINGSLMVAAFESPAQPQLLLDRTLSTGDYFLLGDTPGVSTDSRHFGMVARDGLLGRAWVVYWPTSRVRQVVRSLSE